MFKVLSQYALGQKFDEGELLYLQWGLLVLLLVLVCVGLSEGLINGTAVAKAARPDASCIPIQCRQIMKQALLFLTHHPYQNHHGHL